MPTKKIQMERAPVALLVPEHDGITFNLVAALPGRVSSRHTMRAYFRWIDRYLVDIAQLTPTTGKDRVKRMENLPIQTLKQSLGPQQLRAWMGILNAEQHGKQGLGQARAAITTLASLLSESGWLDDYTSAAMTNVRAPRAEEGQRPGRWLSLEQIKILMEAGELIAKSPNAAMRNKVVITMLCTMALRRDELANAKWGDLSIQNNRFMLQVHGKGRKSAQIDIPKPVLKALDQWRRLVAPDLSQPPANSPLIRRIYKGGGISGQGMTADGIWYMLMEASKAAGIGHVAPHDLRRSVAGALQEAGTPIETISRLLRHSNVAVTERYLSRLPQRNDGAVLMSGVLGMEDDDDLWPGFE